MLFLGSCPLWDILAVLTLKMRIELDPILSNSFQSDLFLAIDVIDFGNYANDNTVYHARHCIYDVTLSLSEPAKKVFQWFYQNQMKENIDICHLRLSKRGETGLVIGDF